MKRALNDFPEWQQAETRLVELQIEMSSMDNEFQQGSEGLRQAKALRSSERLDREASAYLVGNIEVEPSITEQDLEDLDRQRKVVRRAIELHREGMHVLKSKLSREICKTLRPAYVDIVKELATAAVAMAKVVEKEISFRDNLTAGDVIFSSAIRPCPFRQFGRLSEQYSRVNVFLAEAVAEGYLSKSEVEALAR
jgi:hypothetical protein